jgi:hypothetical protein
LGLGITQSTTFNDAKIWTAEYSSDFNAKLSLNGQLLGSQPNVIDFNNGLLTTSEISNIGENYNGVIYEIIIFDRNLSESEKSEVEGYLSTKFDITL